MDAMQLADDCAQYYGLHESPFGLTPNTEFYVDLPSQKRAFEMLLYALSSGEGFIKVTGEVGTGKTMLCRRLLNALEEKQLKTAYIPNPAVDADGLWQAIAREFEINYQQLNDSADLHEAIQQYLLTMAADQQQVILIIDEAQSMPEETLEALRLISNLETERQKLIQIVLFGQPELDETLAQSHLRQLRQRITSSSKLQPLCDDESLSLYLQQRMCLAGYRGLPVFNKKAIRTLWQATQGVPRLVNIVANKALLVGYGAGSQQVGPHHISVAVQDTETAFLANGPAVRWPFIILLGLVGLAAFMVNGGAL